MALLGFLDLLGGLLQQAFFALAVVTTVAAGLDWMVRTRRIPPFSGTARWVRNTLTPAFAPMERRIVRAGGVPTSAPWWTLAAVVVGGIVALSLFGFLRQQVAMALTLGSAGAGGIFQLVVAWTFGFLNIALLVRVLSSWVQASPYSKWVRWSYGATEWFLGPLRRVLPPLGMIDLSPLVAYFLLGLLRSFVIRL